MLRGMMFAGLLLAAPALAESPTGWMKPGPGQETTAIACGVCHTPDYIRMNSVFLSPAQWQAEVTKMQKVYGAPIDDDTARQIAEYLGRNYGK